MRSNLNDDENDPALISKKFWSHVKATSNSSRIPETVSYKGKFRNNLNDQTELFNVFFADQFSDPSNYNIDINFQDDPGNNFSISDRDVRKLLQNVNSNKAQGPDGIHGKILKHCSASIAYHSLLYTLLHIKLGLFLMNGNLLMWFLYIKKVVKQMWRIIVLFLSPV